MAYRHHAAEGCRPQAAKLVRAFEEVWLTVSVRGIGVARLPVSSVPGSVQPTSTSARPPEGSSSDGTSRGDRSQTPSQPSSTCHLASSRVISPSLGQSAQTRPSSTCRRQAVGQHVMDVSWTCPGRGHDGLSARGTVRHPASLTRASEKPSRSPLSELS